MPLRTLVSKGALGLTGLGALCVVLAVTRTAFAQPVQEEDDDEPSVTQPPAALPPVAPPPGAPPTPPPATGPAVIVHVEPAPAAASPPSAPLQSATLPGPTVTRASPWDPGETPYEDPDVDAPYPRRAHFMARVGVGPSVYSFYGDRVLMGGPDVTFAADTKAGSFGGNFGFSLGKTEPGLKTWRFHLGADVEFPIGPVRLGVAPRFGMFSVGRLTQDSSMAFLTVGLAGVVSVDLFHSEGFALALGVRPSIENAVQLFGDSVGLYGGTALLDFRWRAAKTSPPKPPKPKKRRD